MFRHYRTMGNDQLAIIATAHISLPHTGIGAPFPNATVIVAPNQEVTTDAITKRKECFLRYRLKTADPIGVVARFYQDEATRAGAILSSDSGSKLNNMRMITYREPRFMFVMLEQKSGLTTVNVSYKPTENCG